MNITKLDKNNPWLITIVSGVISGVLASLVVVAISSHREQKRIEKICQINIKIADKFLTKELSEDALQIYHETLQQLPKKNNYYYAYIQYQMAQCYLSLARKGNETRENLIRAALAFENSLSKKLSHQSVLATLGLSAVYWNLSWFQETEANIAKSVELFEDITELYPELRYSTPFPHVEIAPNNPLLRKSPEFQSVERFLRTAIQHGEKTLEVCTIEKYPIAYALVQARLGFHYSELADFTDFGSKTSFCKKAIEAFTQSLKVFRSTEYPLNHIDINANIALAYQKSACINNKQENIGHAIKMLQKSLKIATSESYPDRYANNQTYLAFAYTELSSVENKAENLAKAIICYKKALKFYRPSQTPFTYAITQGKLGTLYYQLSDTKDKEMNIRNAIKSFEKGLSVLKSYQPDKTIPVYPSQQEQLGFFYLHFSDIKDTGTNILNAKSSFEKALKVLSPESDPKAYQRIKSMLHCIKENIEKNENSKGK